MKQVVRSRYGDDRLFYYEESKWFVDLKESQFTRYTINEKQELTGIDPDGGPYIEVGDKLSDFSSALPDIRISQIERKSGGIYQLTLGTPI